MLDLCFRRKASTVHLHLSVFFSVFHRASRFPVLQPSLSASPDGSSVLRVSALSLLSSVMERTTAATTLMKPTVVRVTEERNTPRNKGQERSKRQSSLSLFFAESYICLSGQFKCTGTHKCIPVNLRCNGQDDCGDGEDEHDCRECFTH